MTRFYTVPDLADRWQLTPTTVTRYVREGILPAVKLQGVWRFRPDDIEAFEAERYTSAPKGGADDVA